MARHHEHPDVRHPRQQGVTLVELMITVAVLTIVVGIAIPLYNNYIGEARMGTARANMDGIRIALEDYRLDNGDYSPGGTTSFNKSGLDTSFGWSPDGDGNSYSYTVTTNNAPSYTIVVTHTASGAWLRCEDRLNNCCDGTGAGSNSAC